MISERTIQQVRDLSIDTIIKPYVELTKKGSSLMGLCPFHSERTPSFSVSPQKNVYYCFGCRRGGDGIGFIMEKENLSFQEAVKRIAQDNGIQIEYDKDQTDEEKAACRQKESLLAINELVHRYFVDCLRVDVSEESCNARDYAYERWSEDFCAVSGIGYAPKNGNAFIDFCEKNAIATDILQELGLVKTDDSGKEYAFFRERIIIPIRDRWGRIIAFTGRYIGKSKKNV